MLRRLVLHRFARWATLVAMMLGALAPAVSQAVQAARGELAPWSVICSAAESGLPAGPAKAAHPFEHCPYCVLQAQAMAPPPVVPCLPARQVAGHAAPPPGLAATRPPRAWAAPQPRAPPSLS